MSEHEGNITPAITREPGRMDPDAKARWVADLRTPGLNQGRGCLTLIFSEDNRRDCCLGRLCEINRDRLDYSVYQTINNTVSYGGERNYLPRQIVDAFGISRKGNIDWSLPLLREGREVAADSIEAHPSLAALNDTGFTFAQIADVIEFFL